MPRIQTPSQSKRLIALFYGDPGSGKTTLCGTAQNDDRTAPILYIDAGSNPSVLERVNDSITIFGLEKGSMEPLLQWLERGQPKEHACVDWGLKPGFKTVVVDHLTDVQSWYDAMIHVPNADSPVPISTFQHHGMMLGSTTNFVRRFAMLPQHILMTAQERSAMSEGGIHYTNAPALQGASRERVPAYFMLVARICVPEQIDPTYASVKLSAETRSVLQIQRTVLTYCKDQYETGRVAISNPTISILMDIIERKA
jgi:AAA domain